MNAEERKFIENIFSTTKQYVDNLFLKKNLIYKDICECGGA